MKFKLLMFAAAAVAALGIGSSAMARSVKVGIAATPIPPYQAPDASGKFTGWEIEILEAICQDQKLECELVPTTFSALIPELTGGKIDLIMSAMSITDKRLEVIDFSDKYAATKRSVVGQKGVAVEVTPEGLAGKTIGVLQASTDERYVKKYFPKATVKSYPAQDEANQDLIAGRIDVTQSDEVFLLNFLKGAGAECCEVKGRISRSDDLEIFGPGSGVGVRKTDPDLKEMVNKAIKNIRENGKYGEISNKYFDFDIYE
ncbi:transporter substrate-binding domain-containing protein [Mesorhizobium sp. CO1-1-8]|uniref:transporter substrate-binding domain-containing protein n=1 Tax=Mesorhizobium sp. CO1-1-8 TaxID=2876631 RepID=UPI001CD05210|nr:transporter substrate-binding domain-containing protein [Mesorhizobium sp. CO1-1-8]MBZ9772238.1 transporter substrate-binding domain-containing protein [Mesorhizobium sp. CO1-1-8]